MDDSLVDALREAYDGSAEERNKRARSGWKDEERQSFLQMLLHENKKSLLEIGAGPGIDSKFFQEHGLQVLATDLSPEMVRICREKGVAAEVIDFRHLPYDAGSFEAVYALNCLLHVPKSELRETLAGIKDVLKPSGLFYAAVYGGENSEGVWDDDHHRPKRFFSFHTDAEILSQVSELFEIEDFKIIRPQGIDEDLHVQRLILRKS